MAKIEQLEMDAHRAQLSGDVKALVEKYRTIFGWDVPDIDEARSQRLILQSLREVLNEIEASTPSNRDR